MNNVQLMQSFNPMQYDPTQTGGGQFPVGRHLVVISGHDIVATKNNQGGMLVFELKGIQASQGVAGPYRLNLYNNSETSVKIANSQFSAICHVTGVFQLGANGVDCTPLYNIPFYIDVIAQADPKYTQIDKVYDINGNEPGKAPAQGQQAVQQQPQQNTGGFAQQQPQQQVQQGASTGWSQGASTGAPTSNPVANAGGPAWGGAGNVQQQQQPQQQNTAAVSGPAWGQPRT